MKSFLLPLLVVLFSCSREDMTSNNDPEISFDIDGKHFAYIGERIGGIGNIGVFATKIPGTYSFVGYTDNSNSIQILILTPNDTLKTITYHTPPSFISLEANNDHYIISDAHVTIATYQNGTVNGTFAGNFLKTISRNPYVTQPATLTNGLIKNVKITY